MSPHVSENTTRVAVDIGGTFTDLVAVDDGRLTLEKTATTPRNFAEGVSNALERSDVVTPAIDHLVHGTTVVINAITERDGERCALVTTDGFRDVLDITRANRPDMFNFRYEKPEPFVPRRDRFEVRERVDHAGTVLTPLNTNDVERATAEIRDRGIETIAISFLNSYANPEHERVAKEVITEEYPEAYVTVSHELTAEYREYERTNTTVLNSYVRPTAETYLSTLEDQLEESGVDGNRYVMKSNAGTSTFDGARKRPIEMIESGPVGGVYGAARIGELVDEPDVISFDMGGTTAKTSLIENGTVDVETEYWLESSSRHEGYPVQIPVVDIVEIGAGGGSIAWIDQGGSINVGPQSAGADPGPACYGRGGSEPTVTDANLLTGRLNPDYFLGGRMSLDVDRSREALKPIAEEFGTDLRDAAHGILRVVNSNMATALKQVSLRRGHDPRQFVLVASGGAGGLHATTLGRELEVKEILVPRAPGQFSAWGMLLTDLRRDYVRTSVRRFDSTAVSSITEIFDDVIDRARAEFGDEGIPSKRVSLERSADLRYVGQEHTVQTPIAGSLLSSSVVDETSRRFHELHETAYNFRQDDPVELVNLRLTATATVSKPSIEAHRRDGRLCDARKERRPVHFRAHGALETPVYERSELPTETEGEGPAIIEEPACTTLVLPGQTFYHDEYDNLRIVNT